MKESIMNITVLYFASLADKAKKGQEVLTLDSQISLPNLYTKLQSEHGFELDSSQVRVAINDEFADWNDTINEGDIVAFIPPVAGG